MMVSQIKISELEKQYINFVVANVKMHNLVYCSQ